MPVTRRADNDVVTAARTRTAPSPARRGSRLVAALALTTAMLVGPFSAAAVSADDPARAVAPAMERLTAAVDRVVAAEGVTSSAFGRQREARRIEAQAEAEVNRTRVVLDDQRDRYAQLGAASYVLHGTSNSRDHQVMVGAMTARRAMVNEAAAANKAAEEALEQAIRDLEVADRAFANAEVERAAAEAERNAQETAADQALAAVGAVDLPAVAYLAYKRAAATANEADPDCRLSGAVLAGIGRVKWRHGRPTGPTANLAVAAPKAGDPLGPYDLERASAPVAASLCSGSVPLDTFGPLQAAVNTFDRETRVDIVLAAARRYTRIPGVDLGVVPADPFVPNDGMPQFDDGAVPLAFGDVTGMLDWAFSRLGTPYSQCLGPDARPQDPICPPGTNRFGAGFFDCSGFVANAYRRIGVRIPLTTYAQEADPTFMATKVADRLDPAVLLPGDIFLMDGHTGLYAGNGSIIHADGRGLTLEPIPGWVAHATFAVMRPVDPLFGPNPALLAP
jgi:hypothetical protein